MPAPISRLESNLLQPWRNVDKDWLNWYFGLPIYRGQPANCPECGADCAADWSPEEFLYDCYDCGIWFTGYASAEPHRR